VTEVSLQSYVGQSLRLVLNDSYVKLNWKLKDGSVGTTILEEDKANRFIEILGSENAWLSA